MPANIPVNVNVHLNSTDPVSIPLPQGVRGLRLCCRDKTRAYKVSFATDPKFDQTDFKGKYESMAAGAVFTITDANIRACNLKVMCSFDVVMELTYWF